MTTTSDIQSLLTEPLADRYRLLREIGSGGMAVVFLADDLKHGRQVAVKVLRPELGVILGPERFLREIEIAARLQHPHIVPLYDSGAISGLLYYVMPFVEGESLRDRMTRTGPMPPEEAARIVSEVSLALEFAHQRGVVHRDIKPENVMLSAGTAMVTDFGIAHAVNTAGGPRMTQTGLALGTPTYMSPEQASAEEVDGRSDVYSLGCVTFEMLTGQAPFRGPTAMAVLAQHSRDPVPPITGVRADVAGPVERVISKALAKTRADRYQTSAEFAVALDQAIRGQLKVEPERPALRRRFRAAVGIAVLVAGAVGAGLFSRRTPSAVSNVPMIAVLPFEHAGPEADQFFTDGLTDEITSRLVAIAGLGTISRSSAAHFAGQGLSVDQIGRELNVDFLLTGTIRTTRTPDGTGLVVVSPELKRVGEPRTIWSRTFNARLAPGEIFEVQERIAEQVASNLGVTLLAGERAALAERPTQIQAAYEAYLRGTTYRTQKFVSGPTLRAIEAFETAVRLDSTFALAHARLAEAEVIYFNFHDHDPKRLARAEAAAERAIRLDPDLPESRLARGYVLYWGRLEYDEAMTEFERVRARQPNNSELLWISASVDRRRGRWLESVDLFLRALRLDPRSATYAHEVGATYHGLRRYDEAERYFDRAIELAPDWAVPWFVKFRVQIARNGDTAAAQRVMHEALGRVDTTTMLWVMIPRGRRDLAFLEPSVVRAFERLTPRTNAMDSASLFLAKAEHFRWRGRLDRAGSYYDSARVVAAARVSIQPDEPAFRAILGLAYAGLGRPTEALREANAAVDLQPVSKEGFRGPLWVADLAEVQAMIGDPGSAWRTIQQLLATPSAYNLRYLSVHPAFASIRTLPEFQAALREEAAGR